LESSSVSSAVPDFKKPSTSQKKESGSSVKKTKSSALFFETPEADAAVRRKWTLAEQQAVPQQTVLTTNRRQRYPSPPPATTPVSRNRPSKLSAFKTQTRTPGPSTTTTRTLKRVPSVADLQKQYPSSAPKRAKPDTTPSDPAPTVDVTFELEWLQTLRYEMLTFLTVTREFMKKKK
jgi:hypothetical protein